MKLRLFGIVGFLSALGMTMISCGGDTVQGSSSSSSSSSGTSGEGGTGGTGGGGGKGGMGGMASSNSSSGTAGAGGTAGAAGGGGNAGSAGSSGSSGSSGSTGSTGSAGAGGAGGAAGGGGNAGSAGSSGSTGSAGSAGAGGAGGAAGAGGSGGGVVNMELCANGIDDDGEGATDCQDPKCFHAAVCGNLVINEVDYDQVGVDMAEFIEIYNSGATDILLDGLQVVLINGFGGSSVSYGTIPLTGMLLSGEYLVLAQPGVPNIDPNAITQPLAIALANGGSPGAPSPDGILLLDTINTVGIDAICYECTPMAMPPIDINGVNYPLIAGMPSSVEDNAGTSTPIRSIIRYFNGKDSNNDSVDWRATTIVTPGTFNQVATEVCLDGMMLDEDTDALVDCVDPDCAMLPACILPEICDNGIDDDGDMAVDCFDTECNMKPCGANGLMCNLGMCACPGGTMETTCNDTMDNDCDGKVDCSDSNCDMAPGCNVLKITSVDYPVIAHGGTLVITGQSFMGATGVTIGGTNEMFTVDSNTQITVTAVDDATAINTQNVVVTKPTGSSMPFPVTVIRLQINEMDSDTPLTDAAEFVEISTGVPAVNLAKYSLVFFNGNAVNDPSYVALELNGTADANGLLLVGNPGVVPMPSLTFAASSLQNGADAIAIFQSMPAQFPPNTSATTNRLIDVLVYGTNDADDATLLNTFFGPMGSGRMQVDEGTGGIGSPAEMNAIQRCGNGRRNGTRFATGAPTPGAMNSVMPCVALEICDNGLDDDGDMMSDCADSDCDMKTCGMNGRMCSMSACICPGGTVETTCNDMTDDDCDGFVDCNDADCAGTPACTVETCDNSLDDDGDMLIDCADPDCNFQDCAPNNFTCVMNMCVCSSGMSTEAMCDDFVDEDCDGLMDCADPDCATFITCLGLDVTSVLQPVIAHGARAFVMGRGFTGATNVKIGGINEAFTVDSDTQITITVGDATPISAQNLVVTTPIGSSVPFPVTVVRLQISEIDSDQAGTDTTEFVEISTGVPGVAISRYSLVFWDGTNNTAYFATEIDATADANGRILIGNVNVVPPPFIEFADNILQNGADAVTIFQALPSQFPIGLPLTSSGLIDALVYGTGQPDAPQLLDTLIATGTNLRRVQVNETTTHPRSIQRCADGRRDGRKYAIGTPTPGAANNVPACP